MTTAQRLLVPAVLSVALLAGCGGGEKSAGSAATATTTAAPGPATATTTAAPGPAAAAGRFEAEDVAFTFSYPEELQRVDEDDDKQVALLTPDQNDVKNGIKISVVSEQAQPFESYIDTFQEQFESDLGVAVEQRREQHGDYPMGVLEWTDDYTYQDLGEQKTTQLKSTSYFFVGGGKAWQIECLSDPEGRDVIEAACAQILETIAPKA